LSVGLQPGRAYRPRLRNTTGPAAYLRRHIRPFGSDRGQKALTVGKRRSIRPAMAAGAILPPLFFERDPVSQIAPSLACSGTPEKNNQRHQRSAMAGIMCPAM
jgi:hypothetical protein